MGIASWRVLTMAESTPSCPWNAPCLPCPLTEPFHLPSYLLQCSVQEPLPCTWNIWLFAPAAPKYIAVHPTSNVAAALMMADWEFRYCRYPVGLVRQSCKLPMCIVTSSLVNPFFSMCSYQKNFKTQRMKLWQRLWNWKNNSCRETKNWMLFG